MTVPMIWTAKGNMPIADLQYRTEWTENDDEIGMAEIYEFEGEVVRRSVHIRKKQGLAMVGKQAALG
jgi:hypothetical protein